MSGDPLRWRLVVPLKPVELGKSRLGVAPELVRAIGLDTVAAALAAASVAEVVVPTADAALAADLESLGARLVLEPDAGGISLAIARALEGVASGEPRAVLLGDLPALRPEDLDAALALAAAHDRAFVRDVEGDGTSLVTAAPGVELVSRFGSGSAARHLELGLVELDVPASSTLRRDVDTPAQLEAAAALGLGPRTRALLFQDIG